MKTNRINCLDDLKRIRAEIVAQTETVEKKVFICMTGCRALGAADVAAAFHDKLGPAGLDGEVAIVETGCIGLCAKAPVMRIEPWGYLYGGVTPDDIDEIIEKTLKKGEPVPALATEVDGQRRPALADIPFYARQQRNILENCGRIDPRKIEDAVGAGTYEAAVEMLYGKSPEDIIETVTHAGLRGRGGAGFPTGLKWGFCRKSAADSKYLICNADEGDPGAFMDRALLEGDPHRVIEGMIVAAYAIGATHGFIYVRAEYPIAVEHVTLAIQQAHEWGLLGENIAGAGFSFDIEIRMGAGAFVCGEETALIASLEGFRGMPRPRPPFPAERGYKGKPTNINNVETLANVPLILQRGADWYRGIGIENNSGTKIFALAGKVNNTGLVEVPLGTTLRKIIYDIGGGIPLGRKFKSAQMGGPSGGCIPAQYLDRPIDYDSVKEIGAIMGSGGLIVMDENTCMVDIARYFLEFVQAESCGKCTPCRVGTRRMLEILVRITRGEAELSDLDQLASLAEKIKISALCGLGQTAPNPVLSTLRYFRDEYEEHIVQKHCRAGVCEALVSAPCSHACPAGVNIPEYVALIGEHRLAEAVNVIRRRNPFVSVCGRVCDHPCERRCRRSDVDQPLAIRALKRYAADHIAEYETPMVTPPTGQQDIAIIGAGPAGLSCGYFLGLLGRRSVIFEAQPIPGGMLALGIPEYRLPKSILRKDIDFILAHGVQLRTGTPVTDLKPLVNDGFRAVFVATGAQHSRKLGIEGENLGGVVDSLDILRDRGLGKDVQCGSNVAVIGGGNAAVDAARSAVRLGAAKVTILYRRTREEMPAYDEEIVAALEEGVEIIPLVAPVRIRGKSGKVTALELQKMELGDADDSGRRRPIPVKGSEFTFECDMVLPAVGQSASTEVLETVEGVDTRGGRGVKVHPVLQTTSLPTLLAGGDCVRGGATVIEAIGDGQRAAIAIDQMLGGGGVLPPDRGLTYRRPSEETLESAGQRPVEAEVEPELRKCCFDEVARTLSGDQAFNEALRCLRCDLERLKQHS